MQIDLRSYVAQKVGKWFENPDRFQANRLILSDAGDGVALVGPLRVRVCLEGENLTTLFHGPQVDLAAAALASRAASSAGAAQKHIVYSYVLDIPPLQIWPYQVRGQEIVGALGTNGGYNIIIQPAGGEACEPARTTAHACECGCKPSRCHCRAGCGCGGGAGCDCGCGGSHPGQDLPCNYAVASLTDTSRFFPAACEPCPPEACISTPAPAGPAGLVVPPARGGCERPRYFNGMLVTREDMEAEQRFFRLKMKLHNRAAGAGVVWGFCISLDGNDVVVFPGYGVDCCGNDVTVTSQYRVDGASLIRDPAARSVLAQPTFAGHRLHLLLEYVECAEDARPVHGDPCAPAAASCEMSRIRETARLRLVPPRDFDPRGPIQAFLDAFEKAHPPAPGPSPQPLPDPEVPFAFDLTVGQGSRHLQPSVTADVSDALGVGEPRPPIEIVLSPSASWSLSGSVMEVVRGPGGGETRKHIGSLGPGPLGWTAPYPQPSGGLVQYEVTWRSTRSDGVFQEAVTRLAMAAFIVGPGLSLAISVPVSHPKVQRGPALPCLREPCAGEAGPLFPVPPPFIHEDPWHPGEAADPKVLVLAALYALLAMQSAQGGPAPSPDPLYDAAAQLLFGDALDRPRLLSELRKLFAAWCKSALYPGPVCDETPHGVIVGCAFVDRGQIQHLDPWGGRRYVVHYPLLAHWGSMLGIVPVDVLAQRFFSILCCVAGLPAFGAIATTQPPVVSVAGGGHAVPVGSALLTITRAGLTEDARLEIHRTVRVGPVEFVARLLEALQRPASDVARRRVRYLVDESAGISLIVPDDTPAAEAGGLPTRLGRVVSRLPAGADTPPPLLRTFADDLTVELLREIPLPAEDAEGVVDRLRAAGVRTMGELLDREPEALYQDVLSGAGAARLGELIEQAEKAASDVSRAVAAAIKARRRSGLVSREDVADEAKRKGLVDEVAKKLAERGLAAETVDAATARVLGR
jgi:hypothetical protein